MSSTDEAVEEAEVFGVAGVERELVRQCGRGDEQIHGTRTARLAAGCGHRRVDAPIGTSGVAVKRQRIEDDLDALQPILPTGPLGGVVAGVRTGRQFGQRQCGNSQFRRETVGIDLVQVDHDRGVDEATRMRISHAARCLVPVPVEIVTQAAAVDGRPHR